VPSFCSADTGYHAERAPVRPVWFWLSRSEWKLIDLSAWGFDFVGTVVLEYLFLCAKKNFMWKSILFLSRRIKESSFLVFCGGLLILSARCSIKCVWDSEKSVGLILIIVISLLSLTCTKLCFRYDSWSLSWFQVGMTVQVRVSGNPWILHLTGADLGAFCTVIRTRPAQNRVWVRVSFFTRGCTRNLKKP
jgi:hypothetical protein